jgi:predicted  nucleic acid-binding Zn-ribbon protein
VSEYQYYEFRAVDRPLDERELRMLRSLSTRGEITPTSFVNTYNWGDFKGDPDTLMETCFDAFVHVANWGTRRFVLRLPQRQLRSKFLSSCCQGDSLRARRAGEFVVIDFCTADEGGDGAEGEGWMASLIALRADLARGDGRCLYLGWLRCAQNRELDEDDIEPPVPPGLRSLSGSLEAFIKFMGLDGDLVEVAASESEQPVTPPTRDELAAWVRMMPVKDKDALLVDAALDTNSATGAAVLRRFELTRSVSDSKAQPKRRTVGELLEAARKHSDEKARQEAERYAAEGARKERETAKARTRYLDQLAEREQATWQTVTTLVQKKQPGKYDLAVSLLVDLRDLAVRRKGEASFESAVNKLRQVHAAKPSFLRHLSEAGL